MYRCRVPLVLLILFTGGGFFCVAAPANFPSETAPATTAASAPATPTTADPVDAANPATAAEFRRALAEWKTLLVQVATLQTQMQGTGAEERRSLAPQYLELVQQAGRLSPKLQAAAEKAFTADSAQREFGDLLFTMAVSHLRTDNYEEALRLAQMLIDNKYPQKEIYRLAASAAFATMNLPAAKEYALVAADGKTPAPADLQPLLDEIAKYEPLWEREKKFRQADAKADNLPRIKLQTSKGDIVLELFENDAPNTVANFVSLVQAGFYDGLAFHRVLPTFMAQAGDPRTKSDSKGAPAQVVDGPGYTIACECYDPNHREHFRGSLSMAHKELKDTGGSQFFLTFVPTGQLDGRHTVFGRVIEGLDVLSRLQRINPEKPAAVEPDKIVKAIVLRKRNHAYEPKKLTK